MKNLVTSAVCKPEEGWSGQPKYLLKKSSIHFVISFAVVFGLLVYLFSISLAD